MWIFFFFIFLAIQATHAGSVNRAEKGRITLASQSDGETLPGHLVDYEMKEAVAEIVQEHLSSCHIILLASLHSVPLVRRLEGFSSGVVIVEVESVRTLTQYSKSRLLNGLWGTSSSSCRALIVDTRHGNATSMYRFLELAGLPERPKAKVVILGESEGAEGALLRPAFRNSVHVVYLSPLLAEKGHLGIYIRCLYCKQGEAGLYLRGRWHSRGGTSEHKGLFANQFANFYGHEFRVVTLTYFPFIKYIRESDSPGTKVTMMDCLDHKILSTLANTNNFTFYVREPSDGEWGVPKGSAGNWSGSVGTLQHDLADFSMNLTPTRERLGVIWFSQVYVSDPYVVVSLKPGVLPPIFAIVRPFTAEVWSSVGGTTLLTGLVLWLLLIVWTYSFGGKRLQLSEALMYPCGLLLEDPPTDPPAASSARVLIGWWLVVCVVLGTAYRSSLVAFLSVEGKTPPIDSFEDLVEREGWRWGMKPSTGSFFAFFNTSKDPVIQRVNQGMEADGLEGQMKKVMMGGYSFVSTKLYSRSVIASQYTDSRGYTPFYTGKREYHHPPGNSWGVRKGAPFRDYLSKKKLQLIESGLINFWLDDVIRTHVRETRGKDQKKMITSGEEGAGQVVLGLHHLQGAFYLMFLGHAVAVTSFLVEIASQRFVQRTRHSSNAQFLNNAFAWSMK